MFTILASFCMGGAVFCLFMLLADLLGKVEVDTPPEELEIRKLPLIFRICLPLAGNFTFITKKEAKALGWSSGSLEPYAPGKCIGGDSFGNREGILPNTYKYIECDIDTLNKDQRGAKRLVFSKGCEVIYYTDDHYESFELLYGEE